MAHSVREAVNLEETSRVYSLIVFYSYEISVGATVKS